MAHDEGAVAEALMRFADGLHAGRETAAAPPLDPALLATARTLAVLGRTRVPEHVRARPRQRLLALHVDPAASGRHPQEVTMDSAIRLFSGTPGRSIPGVAALVATGCLLLFTLLAVAAVARSVGDRPGPDQYGVRVESRSTAMMPTPEGTIWMSDEQLGYPTDRGLAITMYARRVMPGATVATSWEGPGQDIVLAADMVIDGAYRATFEQPVQVSRRGALGGGAHPEPVPGGQPVELLPGDSVVYAMSNGHTVGNAVAAVRCCTRRSWWLQTAPPSTSQDPAAFWPGTPTPLQGSEVVLVGFRTTPPFAPDGLDPAFMFYVDSFFGQPGPSAPVPDGGDLDTHRVLGPAEVGPGETPAGPRYGLAIRWQARG